jgi:hypothetical protein
MPNENQTGQTTTSNQASDTGSVSTSTGKGEGVSQGDTGRPAGPPKHNPWAEETTRNVAGGPVEVKPVKPEVKQNAQTGTTTQTSQSSQTNSGQNAGTTTDATATPEGQTQQIQTQQTGQSLDPKAIAKEFAAELNNLQKANTTVEKKPDTVTDEQFNQMFKVVNLNDQDFAAIVGFAPEKPEQVQALNSALQRLNVQSVLMANHFADQKIKALESKIEAMTQPILRQTQEQVEERVQTQFFKEYPGLKDYMPLLMEIKEGIMARKQQFGSEKELIEFVAKKAATCTGKPVEFFKTQQVNGNGSVTNAQNQTAGASQRQMTTTSVGGRVAGNNATNGTKKKTTAETLFADEDR